MANKKIKNQKKKFRELLDWFLNNFFNLWRCRYHFYIYIILHNYNKIKIEGVFNVTNAFNLTSDSQKRKIIQAYNDENWKNDYEEKTKKNLGNFFEKVTGGVNEYVDLILMINILLYRWFSKNQILGRVMNKYDFFCSDLYRGAYYD